jgi:S-adenosylmethionine:tRNA ribosyltransferase-isomerase
VWETLAKPGKKVRAGDRLAFGDILSACVTGVLENGNRLVRFEYDGVFEELLDALGETPLPPYITEKLSAPERYQTVYAKYDGSAAAPTAGLHFTEELLRTIKDKGAETAYLTLHVGPGTFRPVKERDISAHVMHEERYVIPQETALAVNRAKARGSRIFAVGTTSCRALESASAGGAVVPGSGRTGIFIRPGYKFQIADSLITNFHLPKSTLIMLVSALAGREAVLSAYAEAVRLRYRFFSFGDAMLITDGN